MPLRCAQARMAWFCSRSATAELRRPPPAPRPPPNAMRVGTRLPRSTYVASAVRSFVRGIPLFNKPAQFRTIIKGQGMLSQMLGPMIGPVVFQSDSEFDKSITTSSKVLSIYAEGVVPGRKRTTRVRIHAVIDTRQPPQQMQPGGPAQASPFANPAGNIVHYRIE